MGSDFQGMWSAYLDDQHRCPRGPTGWWVGQRMRRQHAPETRWSVDLLGLQSRDHVLEIGFGAGHALGLLLERAPMGRVTGMDLSATMLRTTGWQHRVARAQGRLSLVRGDLAALPFASRRFDRILSIHTIYFWPDVERVARDLTWLLAPGGRAVSTFATARTTPTGQREVGPLHERALAVVTALQVQDDLSATLVTGPDSRQFNNVALVIDRSPLPTAQDE